MQLRRNTVLILDDSADARERTASCFRDSGWSVSTASAVAPARQLLEQMAPAVILTELCIQGRWAFDFINELRQASPGCRVCIGTAHPTLESAVQAIRLGFDGYLAKPIDAAAIGDLAVAGSRFPGPALDPSWSSSTPTPAYPTPSEMAMPGASPPARPPWEPVTRPVTAAPTPGPAGAPDAPPAMTPGPRARSADARKAEQPALTLPAGQPRPPAASPRPRSPSGGYTRPAWSQPARPPAGAVAALTAAGYPPLFPPPAAPSDPVRPSASPEPRRGPPGAPPVVTPASGYPMTLAPPTAPAGYPRSPALPSAERGSAAAYPPAGTGEPVLLLPAAARAAVPRWSPDRPVMTRVLPSMRRLSTIDGTAQDLPVLRPPSPGRRALSRIVEVALVCVLLFAVIRLVQIWDHPAEPTPPTTPPPVPTPALVPVSAPLPEARAVRAPMSPPAEPRTPPRERPRADPGQTAPTAGPRTPARPRATAEPPTTAAGPRAPREALAPEHPLSGQRSLDGHPPAEIPRRIKRRDRLIDTANPYGTTSPGPS
jgi:CheY-like chemotaxis protein